MIIDIVILIRFLLSLTRISREGKMFFGSSKKTPHTWGMSESQRRLQLFTPYSSEPPNRDSIYFELLITIWELWKHAETRWKNSETTLCDTRIISKMKYKFLEGRLKAVGINIIFIHSFPVLSEIHPVSWTGLSSWGNLGMNYSCFCCYSCMEI